MTQPDKPPPNSELVTRTIAMPKDTNPHGDIFGGWLVSQMDLGGATFASQLSQRRVITAAIDKMSFIRPVKVGNIVCCYAELVKIGCTSMQINVQAWAVSRTNSNPEKVTEGLFTFVALDGNGRPVPVKR